MQKNTQTEKKQQTTDHNKYGEKRKKKRKGEKQMTKKSSGTSKGSNGLFKTNKTKMTSKCLVTPCANTRISIMIIHFCFLAFLFSRFCFATKALANFLGSNDNLYFHKV